MKHLVPLTVVGVHRDITTTLSVSVPAHEVLILQTIHGRDNVYPGDESGETAIDPDTEFDRLNRKYGEDAVREAYGASGFGDIRRMVLAASTGTQEEDDTAIKLEGPDSKPADQVQAPAKRGRKPATVE